jgi:hypothetical protein
MRMREQMKAVRIVHVQGVLLKYSRGFSIWYSPNTPMFATFARR